MFNENKFTKVQTSKSGPGREGRIFSFKVSYLIWLFLGILEALIALRIVLKMVGANPESMIVASIYGVSSLFLWPFANMIKTMVYGNFVLEIASLFAMIIYALMAWVFERIVWVILYRPRGSMVEVTEISTSKENNTP